MEKFKNLGIIIVPNSPFRADECHSILYGGKEYRDYVYKTWKKKVKQIKDQFGIEVKEDDPLVEIRCFDADHRDVDTNLNSHRLEWLTQTEGTDEYVGMTNYLPASLLKKYKQGDVISLCHVPSGKIMNFKCLVKYISVAKNWEDTLALLNV